VSESSLLFFVFVKPATEVTMAERMEHMEQKEYRKVTKYGREYVEVRYKGDEWTGWYFKSLKSIGSIFRSLRCICVMYQYVNTSETSKVIKERVKTCSFFLCRS
jgi:hypothetical protein